MINFVHQMITESPLLIPTSFLSETEGRERERERERSLKHKQRLLHWHCLWRLQFPPHAEWEADVSAATSNLSAQLSNRPSNRPRNRPRRNEEEACISVAFLWFPNALIPCNEGVWTVHLHAFCEISKCICMHSCVQSYHAFPIIR